MNKANLAYILGRTADKIKTLKSQLPEWVAILTIAGRTELPAERVEFQSKDIQEMAQHFGLELKEEIPGATGKQALELILNSSPEPYWKLGYKGGNQDIFFVTTLDKASGFIKTMNTAADTAGYPVADTGIYIQPRHQGVNCHLEFNLPYSNTPKELSLVQELYVKASEALMSQGAFYTRPYGIWANMAFKKDSQSTAVLKNIKNIFDPNGIMNPGKLCFEV
jgi:hypothetical protein